ncbi:MAG: SCO family protein, partial [Candidatus Heimdallarchaeota archaeon]|nr:SCO family protein [Candidatus Heimdallarchaeota archaeon]
MKDELVSRISKIVLISVMIILVLIVTFNQNPIDELPIMYETSDFTLPSTTGNSYSFSQDAGKVRIVTFTYTKCTVECPQLMDKLDQLNRELKRKSYYEKITFITIDFDYIQDTMNDLSEFQQSLTLDNDNWVFLLGNENQTKQVVQDWNYTFLIDPEHNDTSIPDG